MNNAVALYINIRLDNMSDADILKAVKQTREKAADYTEAKGQIGRVLHPSSGLPIGTYGYR